MTKDAAWRASVEARLDALEGVRPGRKAKHVLVSEEGVCGIDPERDSATCPDASMWRRQKGCLGTACVNQATAYWKERRLSTKSS
jgi:hypothetical protein